MRRKKLELKVKKDGSNQGGRQVRDWKGIGLPWRGRFTRQVGATGKKRGSDQV